MAKKSKQEAGITVNKSDDFSEWYTQVIQKAELIEYTGVSGCMVIRPLAYEMWEKIQQFFDKEIKKLGVRNAYFPLLIPENLLKKEQDHVEGFTPEVAWVTHTGNSKLKERLAIRPTSETIMYDSYKKWIRSYQDLPLLINQWCNVVRWEFKHPMPFIRTREFLWQEGHTAHADKEGADKEVFKILDLYAKVFEELLAVPVLKGTKSDKEKFAGADYTISVEMMFPDGKAIQGATSHALGQNFAKVFGISFVDKDMKKKYVWQNSWGMSTRILGIMYAIHGDDKGLVIPPKMAPNKVVIVPILFKDTKAKVLKKAKELKKKLEKYDVILDERDDYSPGWKFNEWELKGIPVRLELGPRDLKKGSVMLVRRDTGEKEIVKFSGLDKKIKSVLDDIQKNMFEKAKKFLKSNIVDVKSFAEFKKAIKSGKFVKANWCGKVGCEENIKFETGGAKTLNIPFSQPKKLSKCVYCGKEGKHFLYFGKSY